MTNHGFAEDSDFRLGVVSTAVVDALRHDGWFDTPVVPSPALVALRGVVVGFLREWAERSGNRPVDWDAVTPALTGVAGRRRFLAHPRHELCVLFCRIAGIGASGRAFDEAAGGAGLSSQHRTDSAVRTVAASLRAIDQEHFADRELAGKAGLLFERVGRWPFVAESEVVDWKGPNFRQDLQRYCDLTTLNLPEVDDELSPPHCDKSPGQPQCLATWCKVLGLNVASDWFAGRMRRPPRPTLRDEVLRAAHKVRAAFEAWMVLEGCTAGAFSAAGAEFQDEAAKVFFALVEHTIDVPVESAPAYSWFRFEPNSASSLRMWFARAAFEGRIEHMPASVATKWLRVVKQEMSSFRPVLNDDEVAPEGWQQRAKVEQTVATPRPVLGEEDVLPEGWEQRVKAVWAVERPFGIARAAESEVLREHRERVRIARMCQDDALLMPSERFERDREHFLACAEQVFQLEGLWEGMRQLLLAMRALKSPCVASDLRYWEEAGVAAAHYPRQPEEPWRCIPAKFVASFHACVGKEEALDPDLRALRSKFAAFCLNGLRDNWNDKEREDAATSGRLRTNTDMVEPSPHWRFCRVRAAKTLAINPEGRGHRLLQAASEMDPEPSVREAANDAYQSLRRGVGLPEGMSPRRAVLGAFWWLRQAHLKALNIEIDRDGAQRTRIKELSRTKEPEST